LSEVGHRLEHERDGLSEYYNQFEPVAPPPTVLEAWQGRIQPFDREDEVAFILDDLAVGCSVMVNQGTLSHHPGCLREHRTPTYFGRIHPVGQAFTIRMLVFPPPQHPRTIAIYPEISSTRFKHHPHLFRFRGRPGLPEFLCRDDDALCAYRPGDGEWSWTTSTLVTYLDFASIYLAKHIVWVQTGADTGGIWIGPQAAHDPVSLIAELDPRGECRCGSGLRYVNCCRPADLRAADTIQWVRQSYRNRMAQHRHRNTAA
jgi:hypothetical protein